MDTPENELFGTKKIRYRHFTESGKIHSLAGGEMAEEQQIRMMNPMNYIGREEAVCAKYFRIRHGAVDRDTSLFISVLLSLKLKEAGCDVDLAFPWGKWHMGDYDLDELFAWIDGICDNKAVKKAQKNRKNQRNNFA